MSIDAWLIELIYLMEDKKSCRGKCLFHEVMVLDNVWETDFTWTRNNVLKQNCYTLVDYVNGCITQSCSFFFK